MSPRSWIAVYLMLSVSAIAETGNTIVVSASRLDDLDLMAVDTAADVTVIDRATIEQSGAVSVPELLQTEANVLVRGTTGNGNDGQISMRGFGENSHLRTLVLVDGHKANRPDMGGVEWQSIPVSNIARIEVIRGGQNVLYGNHALSGVVKITTKRGNDSGLQLDGVVGSFGYISGSASYGESVGDVDYLVGVSGYESEGYRSNSTSRATVFNASLDWFLNDTDSMTLRTSGGESYQQFPGPLTYEQMQEDPTQSRISGDQFSEDVSALATLLYETERDWGAGRINTGLNYRDRSSDFSGVYTDNRQLGFSIAPRIRLGSEDDFWMTGLDFMYDGLDVDNYLDANRDIVKSWAELGRFTAAPYIFAQRSFLSETILNGGLRYEYAETDNLYIQYVQNQLDPNSPNYKNPPDVDSSASYDGIVEKQGWAAELSVSQAVAKRWDVFAGYDRVYRYPSLDETASYQGFPLSDPLNEDLDPEQGNNFEIGSRYGGGEWTVSLTGFYMMLENEIAFVEYFDTSLGTLVRKNDNIGATRRVGLEPELAWTRRWVGASTRWTFVDARFAEGENDGNRVPLVPWAYGTTAIWVEPASQLRLTLQHSYVSDQYQGGDEENTSRKMDAYGLINFRVNMAVSDHVSLVVSMNNIFDETYATSAYSGGFYPGTGRNFRFGITAVY
jgi:iron complex outermembrane receptor protein